MHNAFGALTSLANLQAIAAMQGAANLSGAGGAAALGGNLDFVGNVNRHAGLGGLGGLGLNSEPLHPAAFTNFLPVTLLPLSACHPFALSLTVTLLPLPASHLLSVAPMLLLTMFAVGSAHRPVCHVIMVAFWTWPEAPSPLK